MLVCICTFACCREFTNGVYCYVFKGTFGISKCSWGWHAVLGRFLEQVIQLLIWFLTSNLMPFHQNLHFSMLMSWQILGVFSSSGICGAECM